PPIAATASARFQYLHACTRPGDRLLITGMTPFDVPYFTERPPAGGHLYWQEGWAADAESEARSLALLERQSVPFAVSNRDPVMHDFAHYPRIRAYLAAHYAEVPGTNGQLLVDTRLTRVRQYGPDGLPCFQRAE
ncbi:MAG TPA: hypothetical protein VNK41_09205, partial [Vicinamibacterales bacterium]|nr:hypothetical protein [Vicinamibacterales bacterium]